jgi:signal peptidase
MSLLEAGRRRAWGRVALILLTWLLVAAPAALLWPQVLGGPVEYLVVSGSSMEPGMHTGDLVLVRRSAAYAVGDTVAYRVRDADPGAGSIVIHRIVGGSADTGFVTQGDNRDQTDLWRPHAEEILGEQWALVPRAGVLVTLLKSPLVLGLVAAGGTFAALLLPSRRAGGDGDLVPGLAS